MPTLRLDVDQETYERIAEGAVTERRPIDWQAEVMLRRAAGLPFPYEATGTKSAEPGPRGPGAAA